MHHNNQVPPTSHPTPSPIATPTFNIQYLSDEYTCTNNQDQCNVQENGWIEQYPDRYDNEPVISNGELNISPGVSFPANVWYMATHGSMISKAVPGGQDFAVETLVNIRLVDDETAVPTGNWNVAGLVIRSATDYGQWIVLNIGLQGPHNEMGLAQTLGVEAKSTTDNNSIFNYLEVPEGTTGETMTASLRICRVGSNIAFCTDS